MGLHSGRKNQIESLQRSPGLEGPRLRKKRKNLFGCEICEIGDMFSHFET